MFIFILIHIHFTDPSTALGMTACRSFRCARDDSLPFLARDDSLPFLVRDDSLPFLVRDDSLPFLARDDSFTSLRGS